MMKPKVRLGDIVLRRDTNGGDADKWVECKVNGTYFKLINEFPDDYRQLNGEPLQTVVTTNLSTEFISEKIVEAMGKYVNGLDKRDLGIPMLDEVAVLQMQEMVRQILENPAEEPEIPEYY